MQGLGAEFGRVLVGFALPCAALPCPALPRVAGLPLLLSLPDTLPDTAEHTTPISSFA